VRVIDTIALSIRTSAQYNPDVEVRPSCILLPDRERQWWGIHRHLDAIYAYIALDSTKNARRGGSPNPWSDSTGNLQTLTVPPFWGCNRRSKTK